MPWIAAAPPALLALLRRMKKQSQINWESEDYDIPEGEIDEHGNVTQGRVTVEHLEDAEAVSSRIGHRFTVTPDFSLGTEPTHCIAIDIDRPAWFIPSSTPGHGHLYVDIEVGEEAYWQFLDACVAVGLVEAGYASASKARGMTTLRCPWIKKGQERTDEDPLVTALQQAGGTRPRLRPRLPF